MKINKNKLYFKVITINKSENLILEFSTIIRNELNRTILNFMLHYIKVHIKGKSTIDLRCVVNVECHALKVSRERRPCVRECTLMEILWRKICFD